VHTAHDPRDDEAIQWESGIFKEVVSGPVMLRKHNLEGDGQSNLTVHGGPDRAVLMFADANYAYYGVPFQPGFFGENLTLEWQSAPAEEKVCLGDVWGTEGVILEISQPRLPCFKLGRRQSDPTIVTRAMSAHAAGWYARVLEEGMIEAGETLELRFRPHPEWTIRRAFRSFLANKDLEGLLKVEALSTLWRDRIAKVLA
ncbi:MAG: MOSC domain-containing protein, partial [Fimbriimonadaceae bacterium]